MKIDVYKHTNDNWYDNYKINDHISAAGVVRVSFTQTGPDPRNCDGEYRVCVWGNDDCGMERDFGADETYALNMFYQVIVQEFVDKDYLRNNGFAVA